MHKTLKELADHCSKLVILGIVLSLFAAIFSMDFSIWTAKADNNTIYIHADGSIDPSTAPILRVDETYTLTADITESIVIEKDNIMINGSGYTVQGVGEWRGVGLDLFQRENVTICDFRVTGFSIGIFLNTSTNTKVLGNILTRCDWGIKLRFSTDNSVLSNNVTNNVYAGIHVYSSDHNQVFNNVASNNEYGIRVVNSSDCDFCWNNITSNSPVGIFLNSQPSAASYFLLLENDISNNDVGLWLWDSIGNAVIYNNFLNNSIQVSLHNSCNNIWDDGLEGNYWSDYQGNDTDDDGIGDELYRIDESNQDEHPLMVYRTRVRAIKPVPFWLQWWFWGICVLAVTTATVFGKHLLQRKTIEMYKRQLESFQQVSHIDKAKMLFEADVRRCRRELEEFTGKHHIQIRHHEESFEDMLKRLGIEEKNKR
jgi:parallel beta-helix repeat protein